MILIWLLFSHFFVKFFNTDIMKFRQNSTSESYLFYDYNFAVQIHLTSSQARAYSNALLRVGFSKVRNIKCVSAPLLATKRLQFCLARSCQLLKLLQYS